jgi:AAA15 family ATPase/GTPase
MLKSWQEELQEEVKDNQTVRLMTEPICERYTVSRKKGELVVKRLVSYHQKKDGTEVKFEIPRESDGSQRLLDLIPAFLALSEPGSNKVFVVDEIDRSLHTLLIRQLLEAYLGVCKPESRTQLLLTTHNALLMDQHLLRRDEIWVTERDALGVSKLFSFSEYKDVRSDKDIRKSYLQGRMGGIPRILFGGAMKNLHPAKECEGSD